MKKLIITILIGSSCFSAFSQTKFYTAVKIEFERTTNPRKLMEEWNAGEDWFERFKENIPTSAQVYSEFIGDTARSIYKPGKEVPPNRNFYQPVAEKNTIYTDYTNGTVVAQKPVYEQTFLINDTLRKIKWKISNDLRNIAGFECRKAFGVMDDSIGIFAFYTDQILINGGPESVQGLPGMILGMGIPRLHTTWFATKVEVLTDTKALVAPVKGKKVDRQTFINTLHKVADQWGPQGRQMLLNFII
ncbi:MAG: GLPGLI family protein [Chitinophagaceae bacterium]|nr:GLPGLI family protein [Chitinophagaceae bacterium]